MKWHLAGDLVKVLAPLVLPMINPKLAPLAVDIGRGMSEAQEIPGASNVEKLGHVQAIASTAASAINATAGKVVVDPTDLNAAVALGVQAVVDIVNATHPVVVNSVAKV